MWPLVILIKFLLNDFVNFELSAFRWKFFYILFFFTIKFYCIDISIRKYVSKTFTLFIEMKKVLTAFSTFWCVTYLQDKRYPLLLMKQALNIIIYYLPVHKVSGRLVQFYKGDGEYPNPLIKSAFRPILIHSTMHRYYCTWN